MEQRSDYGLAIPTALNFSLAAGHVFINLYQFFVLPIYLLPISSWWALTLLPVAALSNPFWSLIHESIHDMFHPASRINLAAGRALSVLFGSSFRVLRISHLMHHKFNRTPMEGTEFYDPAKRSRVEASLGYYFQILGGLYFFEVVGALPFFLPRGLLRKAVRRFLGGNTLGGILFKSLMGDEAIREMRADGAAILALLGLSAFCYGAHWQLLLGALLVRAFLISFLDNVYHYRTPVDGIFYANNLWLPQPVSACLLYFNIHGIHHRYPTLPWIKLPEKLAEESGRFAGNYFAAAVRQLQGPVPLSELPRWSDVAIAPAQNIL